MSDNSYAVGRFDVEQLQHTAALVKNSAAIAEAIEAHTLAFNHGIAALLPTLRDVAQSLKVRNAGIDGQLDASGQLRDVLCEIRDELRQVNRHLAPQTVLSTDSILTVSHRPGDGQTRCPQCNNRGFLIGGARCPTCDGSGWVTP